MFLLYIYIKTTHLFWAFKGEINVEENASLPIDSVSPPFKEEPPPAVADDELSTPPPACHLAVRFFDDESRELLRVSDPSRVQSYSGPHKLKYIRAGFRSEF